MTNALTEAADKVNGVTKDSSGNYTKTVELTQTKDGWEDEEPKIGGVKATGSPSKEGTCVVTYTASTGAVSIEFKAKG